MSFDEDNKRAFDAMTALYGRLYRKHDTRPMQNTIRTSFASARSLFLADHYLWERLGMNSRDALLFSHIKDITRYIHHSSFGNHPPLQTLKIASEFLASTFFALTEENFYIFLLNQRGNLKLERRLSRGLADTALFDFRTLLNEVVLAQPVSGVIIAHNHPGGTLRPSQDDIECTKDAIAALASLKSPLLDHVIVANGTVVSMRNNGFIPESRWRAQAPKNRLLLHWLDGADDD